MERRRADGGPGLLARVRWGNVGRLAALLAAALLILAGPRGCRRSEVPSPPGAGVIGAGPQRQQPPSPLPAATPPPVTAEPAARPAKRTARRRRHSRRRTRARAQRGHGGRVTPARLTPPTGRLTPPPSAAPAPTPPPPAVPPPATSQPTW